MRLDFYYWSYQCPINVEMLSLLSSYKDRLTIYTHDISNDPAVAKALRIYFPTLTIIEGSHRFFSPLSKAFLESICLGDMPIEKSSPLVLGSEVCAGDIVPITKKNYRIACGCTARECNSNCEQKINFLEKLGLNTYGYMNIIQGQLRGGAEYIPSALVPYDIPKADDIAFISCVYLSTKEYDYKTPPLRALEQYLGKRYRKVLAITDEKGVFPNGDLAFFLRNGYSDMGIISGEPGYCLLHLVKKSLENNISI